MGTTCSKAPSENKNSVSFAELIVKRSSTRIQCYYGTIGRDDVPVVDFSKCQNKDFLSGD